MPSQLIADFQDITQDMLGLAGGKAVNLGVLTRAGFPVPPGRCVTTEAYRRITARAGLDEVIAKLSGTDAGDTATLIALAGHARDLVASAPVPDDIAGAIRAAAGNGPVAVRSSATAEDLPYASFAGQQDTYLNITGPDAVLDAVRRCWASLWTDRAVAYRAANGIDHHAVRLAVIIQDMVAAEVAGVMFTADPLTGRRHQMVIDAAPGLGEAVVSGSVNPDQFIVAPDGGITTRVAVPDGHACLTEAQVTRLAALGAEVERHYGSPQDTEWALDAKGEFWLTQARPITTLFPVPKSALAA
ncbi:MAG TPA: PEP/pyruvate-binding domain-containing protein, partial [Thermopolyspora sp.]